ncbi:MAG: hypothetical protein Q9183_006748, partial [Haloplaca sp. 2 TL-2023]
FNDDPTPFRCSGSTSLQLLERTPIADSTHLHPITTSIPQCDQYGSILTSSRLLILS